MFDRWYETRFRWLPLFAALIAAFAWLQWVPNEPVSDQDIYHRTAISVAQGKGLLDDSGNPTAYWAPGYTFYLAFFYYFFGASPYVGFWANGLSYLFLIAGVYVFARQLYSESLGCMAATLTAWYPTFIFYITILASEVFFSSLLIWSLVSCWSAAAKPSKNWLFAFASGLLFGAAILARPQAILLPVIFFYASWIKGRRWIWTFGHFGIITLACLLVLVPWGLRNKRELGEFVLVSANFGANLWMGNHPNATGQYTDINSILKKENLENLPLATRDQTLKNLALQYIWTHPGKFAVLTLKRLYWTMRSESIGVAWNAKGIEKAFGHQWLIPLKVIANGAYYILLLGVLVTLYRLITLRAMCLQDYLLLCLMLLLSLPFLIFQGQDRFHLPLIPYLIILASRSYISPIALSLPIRS